MPLLPSVLRRPAHRTVEIRNVGGPVLAAGVGVGAGVGLIATPVST